MQVDGLVHEVVGWRREAQSDARCCQRNELGRAVYQGPADGQDKGMGVGKGLHGRTLRAACLTMRDTHNLVKLLMKAPACDLAGLDL